MNVVVTPTAQAQIDHQLQYGIEHHGRHAAERTFTRIMKFITVSLASNPGGGTKIPDSDLYEWAIWRTPFIVIYRIEAETETIRIVGFFHHAQDRSDADLTGDS